MANITTNIEIQKKLIASIKSTLKKKNIKVTDGDKRHAAHLRITVNATDAANLQELLNTLLAPNFKCNIQPSSSPMSQKYPTYVLSLTKKYTDGASKFSVGTKIYLVNSVSNKGTLANKDLTPAKFGLNGLKIPEQNLYKEIQSKFKEMEETESIDSHIGQFCLDLLTQIGKPPKISNNSTTRIVSKQGSKIQDADLKIIAKNFGEILGALWYMTNDRRKNTVEYPQEENLPLVDYFIHTVRAPSLPVSAKSEEGAPPGADDAIMTLAEMKKTSLTREQQIARDTLITMVAEKKKGITNSILATHAKLDTDAYQWLQTHIKKSPTLADLDDFIKKYMSLPGAKLEKQVDTLIDVLTPFYKKTGSEAQIPLYKRSITEIFRAKGTLPLTGIIVFPMGGNLIRIFNEKNSPYSSLLKESLRNKNILQIHIYLTSTTIKFVEAPFAMGDFKFTYNAGMKYPNNRPIGFKMTGVPR